MRDHGDLRPPHTYQGDEDDHNNHGFWIIGGCLMAAALIVVLGLYLTRGHSSSNNLSTTEQAAANAGSSSSSKTTAPAPGKSSTGGILRLAGEHMDGPPVPPTPTPVPPTPAPPAPAAQPIPSLVGPPSGPSSPVVTAPVYPVTGQPIDDGCEPEIPKGQHRVVKKDCIVTGDVLVRPAGSTANPIAVFDNLQGTGTVQQLDADYDVWNTQGASVYPKDAVLSDIVLTVKVSGCGTGRGCYGGVFDWHGNRLDQP